MIDGRFEDGVLVDEPVLQIFDPDDATPAPIKKDRILVNQEFVPRLLAEGGILVDGRLTLPRFITEPVAVIAETQQAFLTANAILTQDDDGNVVCDEIIACITQNPAKVIALFESLGNFPDYTEVEVAAQLQMFMPNFIDDVTGALTEADLTAFGDDAEQAVLQLIADAAGTITDQISGPNGFYVQGSYGQMPQPYQHEPLADVDFPTTSKFLGIDMGGAQITADSSHLQLIADDFLGVADVMFLIDTNSKIGEGLPRVGVEVAFGNLSSPVEGRAQLDSLLSALGIDPASTPWLILPNEIDLPEFSLKAYSPGYDVADPVIPTIIMFR